MKLGEWAEFLRRRAELLADPWELVAARPVLGELWPQAAPHGQKEQIA